MMQRYKHDTGQALPLGLALLLAGTIGALVLFNGVRYASDKARLANAADAAAYSGLIWQARALNHQAYTNRAMVANQVSIGQAVSLRSWVTYGVIAADHAEQVLSLIPVINALAATMSQVMTSVETVLAPITSGMVAVVDGINQALSLSQRSMHAGSMAMTPKIVKKVIEGTDDRFYAESAFSVAGAVSNMTQWNAFTEYRDERDGDAMRERASIIRRSMDDFSKKRNWRFFGFWMYTTPITRHEIFREGETRLILSGDDMTGYKWEWKAKDTLSLHTRIWRPFRSTKRIEAPIGWGQAFANSVSGSTIEPRECIEYSYLERPVCNLPQWANRNEQAEENSDRNRTGLSTIGNSRVAMGNYSGVNGFYSLSESAKAEERPSVSIAVEASMSADLVEHSDRDANHGTFRTTRSSPGGILSSLSKAEVYFSDPSETDTYGSTKASSYSPFWDVRLVPVKDSERLSALLLRPDVSGPGSTIPVGTSAVTADSPGGSADTSTSVSSSTAGSEEAAAGRGADSTGSLTLAIGGGDGAAAGGLFELGTGSASGVTEAAVEPVDLISSEDSALALLTGVYGLETLPTLDEYRISGVNDFEAVVANYVSGDLNAIEAAVRSQVVDTFRTAVEDMLRGIVSDYAGSVLGTDIETLQQDIEQYGEDMLQDVIGADTIDQFQQALDEGQQILNEYQDEYIAVREQITTSFENAANAINSQVTAAVDAARAQIDTFEAEIADLRASVDEGLVALEDVQAQIQDAQAEIAGLQNTITEQLDGRRELLIESLVGIFDAETNDPAHFNREMATYMVQEVDAEMQGQVELDWTSIMEGEADDFDTLDQDTDLLPAQTSETILAPLSVPTTVNTQPVEEILP